MDENELSLPRSKVLWVVDDLPLVLMAHPASPSQLLNQSSLLLSSLQQLPDSNKVNGGMEDARRQSDSDVTTDERITATYSLLVPSPTPNSEINFRTA